MKKNNSCEIIESLPGVNRVPPTKPRGFNLNFGSFNTPLVDKVRKQDEEGGGVFWMIIAFIIGMIIAALVK